MKRRSWLIFSVIVLLITSCAPKFIQWSAARPLKWDDFLARYTSGFEAHADAQIKYHYQKQPVARDYLVNFTVQNVFIPYQSWVKLGSETDTLLKHEQLHFDICELYARKLYIALTKYTYTPNYRNEIRTIATNIFKELKQTQTNYDAETQHFFNKDAQAAWEVLVRRQLAQTPEYPHVGKIGIEPNGK
jgi:hypothetical protein